MRFIRPVTAMAASGGLAMFGLMTAGAALPGTYTSGPGSSPGPRRTAPPRRSSSRGQLMKRLAYIGAAVTVTGLALAGCGNGSARPTARPSVKHAGAVPAPTVTVTQTVTAKPRPPAKSPAVSSPRYTPPPARSSAPAQQPPPQQPAPPAMTNPGSVVMQYYQDVSVGDYPAAWALGGDNLSGGVGYSTWVAGYRNTTASISVTSYGTWSSGKVWADISAVQLDGSVKTYSGTYTVWDGVITAADITQTS